MKRIVLCIIIITLGVTFLGAGLNKSREDEDYLQLVSVYEILIEALDYDGYIYDSALESVGKYIAGEETYDNSLHDLEFAIYDLLLRKEYILTYSLPDSLNTLLLKYDIMPEEFEKFSNVRKDDLEMYLSELNRLHDYFVTAKNGDSQYQALVECHDVYRTKFESLKGYYFYSYVNYWFVDWDTEKLISVEDCVISGLKAYVLPDYVWETDKDIIEQKVNEYRVQAEAALNPDPVN